MKIKDYKLNTDITDTISDELLKPMIRSELCRLSEKYSIDIYCSGYTERGYPKLLIAMTAEINTAWDMGKEYWNFLKSQDIYVLSEKVSNMHEDLAIDIYPKYSKLKYVENSVMFSKGKIWPIGEV